MYRAKLNDALRLMKSRMYILITEDSTIMFGDFEGVQNELKLHALKEAKEQLTKLIKAEEQVHKTVK